MVQLYLECYGIQYVQYFIILVNQAKQLTLNTFQLYTFQLHVHLIFKCSFNFRAKNQLLFLMGFFFTYSSILFSLILYSYTGYVVLQLVQLLTFNL